MASRSTARGLCAICSSQHRLVPSSSRIILRSFTSTPPTHRAPGETQPWRKPAHGAYGGRKPQAPPRLTAKDYTIGPPPGPRSVVAAILSRIDEWVSSDRTMKRLTAYGISGRKAREVLDEYQDGVHDLFDGCKSDESALEALKEGGWDVSRLTDGLQSEDWVGVFESSLHRGLLSSIVSSSNIDKSSISHITSILSLTDLTRLPFTAGALPARTLSRHFHLHVGPTNSGKTYSALKALALAPKGAYAGPLRLLAHEVWERLNLGTVGGLDGVGRACNLITGEERRIVDDDSGLISCTVEMLPTSTSSGDPFDVVVIDEIQMMGDMQRGGSWTSAVLGVKAKEVHLCGDDTTVELLSKLIPSLGDRMTIHRYDRLTPLVVADKSLESDWKKVEPGDCIVTFSRTNIFAVKKLVEATAGRKCAVVYGALPPETRAEQAREFNEGRAEVLVASDAVGMGLNLKIKRMIFESLHKFNGKMEIPLPLTSVKQIAGRAGRFGMHKTVPALDADLSPSSTPQPDPNPSGGSVTTLHATDLPILRQLLPLPLPSLPRAILDIPFETLSSLSALLPPSTTYAELIDHLSNLVLPPAHTTLGAISHKLPLADVVEEHRDRLSLDEMELFCYAPISTRDQVSLGIFRNVIASYANKGHVDVKEAFGPSGLFWVVERCEMALEAMGRVDPAHSGSEKKKVVPGVLISSLPLLETLHKSLVAYIWLGFRFPIAFPDVIYAQGVKARVEVVLESCLEMLPGLKKGSLRAGAGAGVGMGKGKMKERRGLKGEVKSGMEGKEEKRKVHYVGKAAGEQRRKREVWGGMGLVGGTRLEM